MGIDVLIKKRIFRITLAVFIAVIAVIYIALVQYSFNQNEGTWVVYVREDEIGKISDEAGLHFIPPGEQVVKLPKSAMIMNSQSALVDIQDRKFNINYSILWRITSPEKYLEYMMKQDNPDMFSTVIILKELQAFGTASDSLENFINGSAELQRIVNNDQDIINSGVSIDNIYITDFYPYISDIDASEFSGSDNKLIADNLKLAEKIRKQFDRDSK